MSKRGILADLSEINHFSCCSETTVEENGDDEERSKETGNKANFNNPGKNDSVG